MGYVTSFVTSLVRRPAYALLLAAIAGCVSVPAEQRALSLSEEGKVTTQSLACETTERAELGNAARLGEATLDGKAFRVLTWNIHKEEDSGWETDLTRFAGANDLLLLQEVTLRQSVRQVIEDAKLGWVMASSFVYRDDDIGVLTASRVKPVAVCTQRVSEPLLRLPKSAVVSWFRIAGSEQTLAVVNLHAINFSLTLGNYREQFKGLTDLLATHEGPIIFAGDLNTWWQSRLDVLDETAKRLQLTPITFTGEPKLFFGHQLDHILVRGLEVVEAQAVAVKSSDHNPVGATLRLKSVEPVGRAAGLPAQR
jgi:endonuclease/exonuclease/phosphatase (EEP) superfamily protein YafD